jgi:hypothetical protein
MTTNTDIQPAIPAEVVAGIAIQVLAGKIALKHIAALAVPKTAEVGERKVPPVPTIEQNAAMARLKSAFGKVAPTAVRSLTEDELRQLLQEYEDLKIIEGRRDSIKHAVLNHNDLGLIADDAVADAEVNKDGHYIKKSTVKVPGSGKAFSWEISERGGGEVTAEALADLEAKGVITHDDYLACTTQVRVVDEAKVLGLLSDGGDRAQRVLEALATAGTPMTKVGALYVRSAK